MRSFLEFKGQSIRLVYDRERADFVLKTEPHPFVVPTPAAELKIEPKHRERAEPAGRPRC